MARLFNAARRKKSKSGFTNLGLENYKYTSYRRRWFVVGHKTLLEAYTCAVVIFLGATAAPPENGGS